MKSLIRNVVHNILLETRANLSIRPMMKQWVQVAVDHGINDTKALCTKLPGSLHDNVKNTVGLKVPKNKSHLVFEGLTPETQEWVLKHWKTKEYFTNMISGVILGIVSEYSGHPGAVGMKSGNTMISLGTYNEADKTWVGGADGYLSIKGFQTINPHLRHASSMFLDVPDNNSITIFNVDSLKVDKRNFKKLCTKDLRSSDSVLYHEFQHWFQETVMFADERLKRPTKASKAGSSYSVPKGFKEQVDPPMPVSMMLLKQIVKGVDFLNPKDHPSMNGNFMYEIKDQTAFIDSLQEKVSNDGVIWPNLMYRDAYVTVGQSINDGGWMKDFIENTLKTSLTPEGEKLLFHGYGPIEGVFHSVKWAKDAELPKLFIKNNSGKFPHRLDKPYRKAFEASCSPILVFLVPKSHVKKDKDGNFTEEIKPNKKLVTCSRKRIIKDNMYVIFTKTPNSYGNGREHAYQTSQKGKRQGYFEKAKNPLYGGQRLSWDERWVEFDAESRNYLAAAVDTVSEFETFKKALVRSDDEKLAKLLLEQIKTNLRGRINRRITNENEAELISMCDRIADKFVEEAEAMTLFDFQDSNPHPNLYQLPNNPSTEENVQIWLDGGNYFSSRYGDYFRYIKDRVFGEV